MTKHRFFAFLVILTLWLSTTGFFSAPAVSAAPAPSFGKSSPDNGATNVSATSLSLSWGLIQNYTGTDTVTYRYCIQVASKNKCPGGRWIKVGAATTATVSNLKPGTTYKWWVRAYDSNNRMVAEADNGNPSTFTTANPPGGFTKSTPLNGATGQLTNGVQLTWSASTNAAHYEYCLDTTNNNRCDTGWIRSPETGGIPARIVTLAGLSPNTVYYWQVRAINGGGATYADVGNGQPLWRYFTTTLVPDVFNKLSPDIDATGQLTSDLALSWTYSLNATSYEYCVSIINNTCSGTWQNVGNVTTATVSGLNYSADYYWQVRAVYSNTTTPANGGTWWKFSTQPPPPMPFGKSLPGNPSVNVYTDVTFTWEVSSGASRGYEFCLSPLAIDLTCGDNGWVKGILETSTTVPGLDPATTYYWQVRSVNDTGTTESNNGTWWSFTTQPNPPLAFGKDTPVDNGPTKVDVNLSLIWNATTTPGVTYEVCYDRTDDDACDQDDWHTVGSDTSYNVVNLTNNTIYYWQVRARNDGGLTYADGDQSAWWSFTTKLAPPKPFTKFSPADDTGSPQPINPTLVWTPSDPGITYEYCVRSASKPCDSPLDWISVSGTSVVPQNLSYGTPYQWQVRAKNSDGTITEADNGDWWSFTTYGQPPANFEKIGPSNGATRQPKSAWLTWSYAGLGYTYQYCLIETNITPAPLDCTTLWSAPTSNISVQLTSLHDDATYYWQVRAVKPGTPTTYANADVFWHFTTLPTPPTSLDQTFDDITEDTPYSNTLQGTGSTKLFVPYPNVNSLPTGVVLDTNGNFTYTPDPEFCKQVTYQFTVTDGINEPVGPFTATLVCNPVNDPPVLNPITVPATVTSGAHLTFTATGTDVDLGTSGYLTYWINSLPPGATMHPYTGVFSWTPTYSTTSTNTYTFKVTVSDGQLTDEQEITISVLPLVPTSQDETFTLTEDGQRTGALLGADTTAWTFAVDGSAPNGLTLQPNGHFTYTPPNNKNGTVTFDYYVTNTIAEEAGPYTVTFNITPVNDAPALNTITIPASVLSAQEIRFTASATDVDLLDQPPAADHMVFSIANAPSGASINATTGDFSWTPTYAKNGPNTYTFTIIVADGSLSSSQNMTVTVQPRMLYLSVIISH